MDIVSTEQFTEALQTAGNKAVCLYFFADWHQPCKQMDVVVSELSKDHPSISFLRIEAEKDALVSITEQYPVESIPTFVFLRNNKVLDVFAGANPAKLVQLASKHAKAGASFATGAAATDVDAKQAAAVSEAETKAKALKALNARLAKLVKAAPVMLFCKGTPAEPKCGFSRSTIALLNKHKVKYGYFDILTDNAVRQGLKTFSNWRTYPQIYINGELVGGLDVIKELEEDNELLDMIPESSKPSDKPATSQEDLNTRLKALINRERVMLFMKGTAANPQCGFSNRMVALLKDAGFGDFGTFNILEDMEVRQGLKTYSNWPTFPQLYVDGELIGGLDVVTEMHGDDELAPLANAQ